MAEITKPDLSLVWASAGDVLKPSDSKIQSGWAVEIPPRQWFNWLDNRQDQAIAHINQHGIPVWDDKTEYQAGKSYVQGSDGNIYRAVTTNTNVNPVGDNTNAWSAFNSVSTGTAVFTANGSFTVPGGVTTIYVSASAGGAGGGGGAGYRSTGAPGGGGGGAGQSVFKQPLAVTPGQIINITIGGAGTAGNGGATGSGGGDGTNGGNTTLVSNSVSILTLTGGISGKGGGKSGNINAGGFGGNFGATDGGDNYSSTSGGTATGNGGAGGGGPFGTAGGGARAGTGATNVLAAQPIGYGVGGGGGGGTYGAAGSGRSGQAGRPGIVILEW